MSSIAHVYRTGPQNRPQNYLRENSIGHRGRGALQGAHDGGDAQDVM